MSGSMQTAALAGVPSGIQATGVWAGRRQLFIRFAGEAETATMYTSGALVRELAKISSRASFHSICAAQGGFREPTIAPYTHVVTASRA